MRTGKQRPHEKRHPLWTAALVLTAVLLFLAVAASFLPLIETNVWWVRFFDFARVQFAVTLLVLFALLILFGGLRRPWSVAALVAGLIALSYQAYRLYPYSTLPAPMAVAAPSCAANDRLDLLVANVQQSNEQFAALSGMVDSVRGGPGHERCLDAGLMAK